MTQDLTSIRNFSIISNINILNQYLFVAARTGNTKAVEWALKVGADIEYATPSGHTPLYAAIYEEKIETVDLLIKAGARASYETARYDSLFIAAYNGLQIDTTPLQRQIYKIVNETYTEERKASKKQEEEVKLEIIKMLQYIEQLSQEVAKKTEFVFERYNEPIDLIKEEFSQDNLVVILNKGAPITDAPSHWRIFDVENEDLDPQAYLQYTVDEYNNLLARGIERVVFIQGLPGVRPIQNPVETHCFEMKNDLMFEPCPLWYIDTEYAGDVGFVEQMVLSHL